MDTDDPFKQAAMDLPSFAKVFAKHKAAAVGIWKEAVVKQQAAGPFTKVGCQCPTCQLTGEGNVLVSEKKKWKESPLILVTGVPLDARPEWGLREAIREFILNAKDAETEFETKAEIEALTILSSDGSEHMGVVITTPGAHLPAQVLTGFSGWQSKKGIYGRFGEGILMAAAAILRTPGCSLSILSGGYTYDAQTKDGANWLGDWYPKKLVAFSYAPQADYEKGVQIQIDGVPKAVWAEVCEEFTSLHDMTAVPKVKTKQGTIYFDDKNAGRIWVRGFRLPQAFPLKYGYDFDEAPLTRDRTLDPSVNIPFECACIWIEAFAKSSTKPIAGSKVVAMVASKLLDGLLIDHVVPLEKLANAEDVEKVIKALSEGKDMPWFAYKTVAYEDLTADEKYNLNLAMALLLGKHAPKMMSSVEIFSGALAKPPFGNWQVSAAKISINRKNLGDHAKVMASLLGGLAEFQSKYSDEKGTPSLMWAAVMATNALDRLWKELDATNKKCKAAEANAKVLSDAIKDTEHGVIDLALAT